MRDLENSCLIPAARSFTPVPQGPGVGAGRVCSLDKCMEAQTCQQAQGWASLAGA